MSASLTRQIFGTVSQVNGLPLSQVQIDLLDTEDRIITSVCSDTAGAYVITNVPDGKFELIATTRGYCPYSVCIIAAEETGNICVDISLTPRMAAQEGASISGFLTDSGGTAVSDVWVGLYDADASADAAPRMTTQSLSNGYYSFTQLCPGAYQVRAKRRQAQSDGTTATSGRIIVNVDEENSVSLLFCDRVPSGRLPFTISVVDEDTALPLSGVTVCARYPDAKQCAVTDNGGEAFFSFPDTVQYISLSLERSGYQPHSRFGVHLSGGYRKITMRVYPC